MSTRRTRLLHVTASPPERGCRMGLSRLATAVRITPAANTASPRVKKNRQGKRLVSACYLGFLVLLCTPCFATSQTIVKAHPSQIEAAFLRNFARYVTWPAHAFSDDHSPWHICILGTNLFDDVLEETLQGRTEQGRPFAVFRADSLEQLPVCQIVFVGHKNAVKRRAVLDKLKSQPVLTVGDTPEFLQEGGIIRFQVGDHVEMSINLDQARSTSLLIQTKMLEVSRDVLENGSVRKWR